MGKYKILICDDSKLVRTKLKKIIKEVKPDDSEIEFMEAVNGEESIQTYQESDPDLMFLDIVMPNLSGIEVVKKVINYDPEADIIMASSAGTKKHLRKALEYGARDFIQKPITKEKVKKVVRKLFDK